MNLIEVKHQLFKLVIDSVAAAYPNVDSAKIAFSEDQIFKIPELPEHGFLTTNAALQLQSLVSIDDKQANPREIAQKLVDELGKAINKSRLSGYISKVDIAGPGFINFYASDRIYIDCSLNVLKEPDTWGTNSLFKNKNILIEFTDPNPFKEFHIGHLMSNCIGESLARLYEFSGAKVHRLCYQGDVGMHVAKTIWAWRKDENRSISELSDLKLAEKVNLLGKWYAMGSKIYADGSDSQKEEIKLVNKLIFSREDKDINKFYDLGKKWSLEAFDVIYSKLGTKFEKLYFESNTGKVGQTIVSENIGQFFEKSKGAVIFPGEKYGLHSRVFINSQGLPTYEAKELGLAVIKDKDFNYDLSIIVTGNEVNDYFKVLLKVLEQIEPTIYEKTTHIGHGMLRLPSGKMSSRTGNVVTGNGLLELVSKKIIEVNPKSTKKLADNLAVSAIKFSLLKQNIGNDVVFDIDESVSLHGATGVYIQYTHARANSLLTKARFDGDNLSIGNGSLSDKYKDIYREIFAFPLVVAQASINRSPNSVAIHLLNISQLYNSFYTENRIIGSEKEQEGIVLTYMVKQTLANGLKAIGINPVSKM